MDLGGCRDGAGQLYCIGRDNLVESSEEVGGDYHICGICLVHRFHLSTLICISRTTSGSIRFTPLFVILLNRL